MTLNQLNRLFNLWLAVLGAYSKQKHFDAGNSEIDFSVD